MDEKNSKINWKCKVYDLAKPDDMKRFVKLIYYNVLLFPKSFPSSSKLIKLSIGLFILTVIIGILLSIHFNDWLWFSRFGSLCIIIGILFIFYDVSDYYDSKLRAIDRSYLFMQITSENFFEKILNNPNLPDDKKAEIKKIEVDLSKNLNCQKSTTGDLDLQHEKHLQKNQLRKCEALILILGTLIWGFGDLIGTFFKK